jgi:K+ transporter
VRISIELSAETVVIIEGAFLVCMLAVVVFCVLRISRAESRAIMSERHCDWLLSQSIPVENEFTEGGGI